VGRALDDLADHIGCQGAGRDQGVDQLVRSFGGH